MGSRKGAGRLREEWQHHQQLSTQEARVMDGKLVEQAGGREKGLYSVRVTGRPVVPRRNGCNQEKEAS